MKSTLLFFPVLLAGILVVSAQYQHPYAVHNITHYVVNTTYVQQPAPPGFIRNVTGPDYSRSYNSFQGPFNPINQNANKGLMVGTPGPYDVTLIKQVFYSILAGAYSSLTR